MRRLIGTFLILVAPIFGQTPTTNFEPSLVHPIAISPSGHRLFALNSDTGTLRVFSLNDPQNPTPILDIPLGLAPVSLRPRNDDEVWVVDALSDSISVVSIPQGIVTRVLQTKDDPADIVFAGNPQKAYVSIAGRDEIQVFDVASGNPLATISVPGKEPRSLAVDGSGSQVYALVFRSGNRTTLLPASFAPLPPAPTNPSLPPAPPQSKIVSLDDPMWASHPLVVPDIDLVRIDVATDTISAQVTGVGTINYDFAIDPLTGVIVVAKTDARNAISFEPNLKSNYYDSGLTFVDVLSNATIDHDLNLGVTSKTKSLALSEPTAIVIDATRRRIWVAAQGSDRIAQVSDQGEVVQRIDLTGPFSQGDSQVTKRGPRGLALTQNGEVLYVFNRMSQSVSIVDTTTAQVTGEVSLGFDPMSPEWRRGQGLLYDARLSADGTVSCASCHIDGEHDLLSWDLGDPGGTMTPVPAQAPHPSFPANAFPPFNYHPMKGPMVTQTLRGLKTNAPYHWRGDKARIQDFNGAFVSLLGGSLLNNKDIDLLAHFLTHISHPGNPNQNLDRTLPAPAAAGKVAFDTLPAVAFPGGFQLTCADCHGEEDGSGKEIVLPIPQTFIGPSQPTNTPQLRGLFRRGEAPINGSPSKVGFGFAHDGGLPTMRLFLDIPAFSLMPNSEKNNLVAFLEAFDTGTAPIVGHRYLVNWQTANTTALFNEIVLLQSRALAKDCDLILESRLDGKKQNFVFNTNTLRYDADVNGARSLSAARLNLLAAAGRLSGAALATPFGEGRERAFGYTEFAIGHRESQGANPQPNVRLELINRRTNNSGILNFVLIGLPQGASAELLVAKGPGLKTQHTSGRWVRQNQLLSSPLSMKVNGSLHYGHAKTGKNVITVQARLLGLPGGLSFSNAITIKGK